MNKLQENILMDESVEREGFKIDSLEGATWAFRKLRALTEKQEEVKKIASEEIEKVEKQDFISTMYKMHNTNYQLLIPEDKLNKKYEEEVGYKIALNRNGIFYNNVSTVAASCFAGEKNVVDLASSYIKEGNIDNTLGVILIDGRKISNKNGENEVIRGTNYKVGDSIRIAKPVNSENPLTTEDKQRAIDNNDYVEVPIIAIADKDPIYGQYGTDTLGIVMSNESYNKYIGQFKVNLLAFDFDGDSQKQNEAIEYFDSIQKANGYVYGDLSQQLGMVKELFNQVEFFVYCFIIVITIISIVNILNTISTNIIIRKREFSILKAIGMTEKQLNKSVILEGTLYGIISGIFGGVISAVLLAVLVKLTMGMAVIEYKFDFAAFIGSIVAAILITYIATLIPLRKLRKLSIVEGIRDEE